MSVIKIYENQENEVNSNFGFLNKILNTGKFEKINENTIKHYNENNDLIFQIIYFYDDEIIIDMKNGVKYKLKNIDINYIRNKIHKNINSLNDK